MKIENVHYPLTRLSADLETGSMPIIAKYQSIWSNEQKCIGLANCKTAMCFFQNTIMV